MKFNMPECMESETKQSLSELASEYKNRHMIDDPLIALVDTVLYIQDSDEKQQEDLIFITKYVAKALSDALEHVNTDESSYSAKLCMMTLNTLLRSFFIIQEEENKPFMFERIQISLNTSDEDMRKQLDELDNGKI